MAADVAASRSVTETVRRSAHRELRQAVVDLAEAGVDEPARLVEDVWASCVRVGAMLRLVPSGHHDRALLQRVVQLLSPARRAHGVVRALDDLDVQGAGTARAEVEARVAALDAQLWPGCATPDTAASLLAEIESHVDGWPLPDDDGAIDAAVGRSFEAARRAAPDGAEAPRLVRELVEVLALAGRPHDDVADLADRLDRLEQIRDLEADLGPSAPVAIAALARARRAELREQVRELAAAVFGPAT